MRMSRVEGDRAFLPDLIIGMLYASALGTYLCLRMSLDGKRLRAIRYSFFFLALGSIIVAVSTYIALAAGNWLVSLGGFLFSLVWGVILAEIMILQSSGDSRTAERKN
jgi:hypothetical protein